MLLTAVQITVDLPLTTKTPCPFSIVHSSSAELYSDYFMLMDNNVVTHMGYEKCGYENGRGNDGGGRVNENSVSEDPTNGFFGTIGWSIIDNVWTIIAFD